jgi:hypothetical protein
MRVETKDWIRIEGTQFVRPPENKITCKICFLGEYTGCVNDENNMQYPSDMDSEIHEGFTIGKGKTLYWMMIWHGSGNVTVFPAKNPNYRRWISGDTEITIHWKK